MKKAILVKNLFRGMCVSLLLFTGGLLMSCGTAPKQESTGQYLDSSVITAKVKSELLADDNVKGLDISVTTYKNIVDLSGFVDNRAQARRAVELTRRVEGVREVRNGLIIKRR